MDICNKYLFLLRFHYHSNSHMYIHLNFPKNLHSNTGTGDYFPKKVISS